MKGIIKAISPIKFKYLANLLTINFLFAFTLITLSLPTTVKAQPVAYYDVTAFLGAEYYLALMKAKSNWNQILPNNFPGASVYVGTQFHEFWGIEIGYDWSIAQKKNWSLTAGQTFFGSIVNANFSGSTRIRRSGGHVDFIGFLPVGECTDLLGFIGAGWIEPKITVLNMSLFPTTAVPNSSLIASISGNGRGTFRMGVGLRYLVTNIFGIRGKIGWESTSTLIVKGNALFTPLGYTPKAFKGTTSFSVGAFVMF